MRRWLSEHLGLRLLAFFLALLLWFYVTYIETGRVTVVSSITK